VRSGEKEKEKVARDRQTDLKRYRARRTVARTDDGTKTSV
jgi:hypothetical protein